MNIDCATLEGYIRSIYENEIHELICFLHVYHYLFDLSVTKAFNKSMHNSVVLHSTTGRSLLLENENITNSQFIYTH